MGGHRKFDTGYSGTWSSTPVTTRTGRWFETLSAHACFLTPFVLGSYMTPFATKGSQGFGGLHNSLGVGVNSGSVPSRVLQVGLWAIFTALVV